MELLICTALLGIVLWGVYMLITSTTRHYSVMTASLDLQREALLASSWITKEMAEGNKTSFAISEDPPGISFGSPRTLTGGLQYTEDGRLVWQKVVCYYIEEREGVKVIIRKEKQLDPKKSVPPYIWTGGGMFSLGDYSTTKKASASGPSCWSCSSWPHSQVCWGPTRSTPWPTCKN